MQNVVRVSECFMSSTIEGFDLCIKMEVSNINYMEWGLTAWSELGCQNCFVVLVELMKNCRAAFHVLVAFSLLLLPPPRRWWRSSTTVVKTGHQSHHFTASGVVDELASLLVSDVVSELEFLCTYKQLCVVFFYFFFGWSESNPVNWNLGEELAE